MKRFFTALVLTLAALGCFGATQNITGSGTSIKQARSLRGFTQVSTSAGIDVEITQGDGFKVEITADKNVMPYVVTEVSDACLSIRYKKGINISRNKIRTVVKVTAPEFTALSASSSGNINVNGILRCKDLSLTTSSSGDIDGNFDCSGDFIAKASSSGDITLKVKAANCSFRASSSGDIDGTVLCSGKLKAYASSSGDIELTANAKECEVASSSSSDVTIEGKAETCKVDVSSAGGAYLDKLECKRVIARVSSAGNIEVWASESLDAEASSGGSIYYSGSPKRTNFTKNSGGSVKKS